MRFHVRVPRPPFGLARSLPGALRNFYRHDTLTYAGALAFFFLLSLFPLLILLASALAYVPAPNLFQQIVELMELIVPAKAMGRVETVLAGILRKDPGLLSFGILASVWVASAGFEAVINGLNRVYEVAKPRPYWRKRLVALGLTLLIGGMTMVAVLAGLLGPFVRSLLPGILGRDALLVALWPYLQWVTVLLFLALSIQILYFVGPNRRQSFREQTPGAFLAVGVWIGISLLLDSYLRNFASYNQFYGVMEAVIALLVWFYLTALALLLGAEWNAEILWRRRAEHRG